MTIQLRVRVAGELNRKAETIAHAVGLGVGDLVKMALAQVVRENGIPPAWGSPKKQTAPEVGGRSQGKG
jgi:antitoxin component of RelBE/YafQ-DinJ toxin-antitoxin module